MTASALLLALGLFGLTYTFVIAWRAQANERLLAERLETVSREAFGHLKAASLTDKTNNDIHYQNAQVQIEHLKDALSAQHKEIVGKNHAKTNETVYTEDGRPLNPSEWEIL